MDDYNGGATRVKVGRDGGELKRIGRMGDTGAEGRTGNSSRRQDREVYSCEVQCFKRWKRI